MQAVETLVEELGSSDHTAAQRARREVRILARQTGEAAVAASEQVLAALIHEITAVAGSRPKHNAQIRSDMAELVNQFSGEGAVLHLRAALLNPQSRSLARWLIDRVSSPQAVSVLMDAALQGNTAEFRIEAIQALGRRAGSRVVETLKTCALDPNPDIASSAIDSLSVQPDLSVNETIRVASERSAVPEGWILRLHRARLRLAHTLLDNGQRESARVVCQDLLASCQHDSFVRAAEFLMRQIESIGNRLSSTPSTSRFATYPRLFRESTDALPAAN